MIENGESRPFWQYYILGKPCSSLLCDKLKEKIIPFNYPFWDIFYPPNHPGCNASIRALTKKEVAEGGLQRLETIKIIHPFPEWAFNSAKFEWRDFFL